MSSALVVAITIAAVVLTVLGLASTVARRRIGLVHLVAAGVLEALLVLQAVLVGLAMAGGERPAEVATFVSYLATVVLVPVAGVLWARVELTRWAGSVLAVAGAVVGVMVWRLLQLWEAAGG